MQWDTGVQFYYIIADSKVDEYILTKYSKFNKLLKL